MQNRFGELIQPLFKKSFYHQGFFAVKRRVVFILGAKWIALVRGWRRIVWLAAWKLFPMTQSAQSHRQMRSIPRCFKAVFYVFVFGPIHDSETMRNLSPGLFPLSRKNKRKCLSIFAIVVMDYFFVVGVGFGHEAVERGMV